MAGDLSQKMGIFTEARPMTCNMKLIVLCVEVGTFQSTNKNSRDFQNMSKYHSDKILRRKKMSLLDW